MIEFAAVFAGQVSSLGPSGMLVAVRPMRWLMIVFLVSLGALLFAAAGLARHIWLQRAKPGDELSAGVEPAEEPDMEGKS